ncbi:MAG: ATP-binding cassette domain-containing protein [Bacilli bacterium]|nr:ATP-binding cassette domain-containing protein [Bacilli bacterium]
MSIEIKNLTKYFKNDLVVNNLCLKTPNKGLFALLGLNGAGKTTTINIICSITNKTSGNVIINGDSVSQKKIKRQIGLSPQENAVDEKMTVYENLEFFASLYGVQNKKNKILNIIKKFALDGKTKSKAKNLSGGQKRKLSLAMALITEPKILILDEPTLGLDVVARKEL